MTSEPVSRRHPVHVGSLGALRGGCHSSACCCYGLNWRARFLGPVVFTLTMEFHQIQHALVNLSNHDTCMMSTSEAASNIRRA